MASLDEIARRVEDTDNPRTAKRSATAQRVAELAGRRANIVAELDEVERQLGDVLVDADDVIDDEELARFTDVARADLTRWRAAARTARKATGRGKRPRKSTEDSTAAGAGIADTAPDARQSPADARAASTAPEPPAVLSVPAGPTQRVRQSVS